jgi:2-amino-4-hydroxy-6-hydroxymethyldihydropteridine diphosphokinase
MDRRRRAYLALGSNLGDRASYLREAVCSLPDVVRCSGVFETAPIGGPADQGAFYNIVVELDTALTARALLNECQRCEQLAQRVRTVRNGPRTLDVDVLWIDGERVNEPDLIVPHARMFERAFVLAPLSELAPDIVAASWDTQVDTTGVTRIGALDEIL